MSPAKPVDFPPTPESERRRVRRVSAIRWIALSIGIVLFLFTVLVIDIRAAARAVRTLGTALPIALAFSALWHVARTWAWAWCFPAPRTVSFLRLVRVRLAAEAFSYLTIRGIAGEPLKVVLLAGAVDTRHATAAVALERLAYMVGTTLIVGAASVLAMVMLPLSHGWFRVFRAFALAAGVVAALTAIAVAGRGTYLQSLMRRIDRRMGSRFSDGRVGRFVAAVERLMLELVREHPTRLLVLFSATCASFLMMALEAWVILHSVDSSITIADAYAVETFSRVASFASAFIPANLGALEASSVAAAAAVGATGGAALAVARRIRGLFWAGVGLLIYPREPATQHTAPDGNAVKPRNGSGALLYVPCARDVAVPPWTCVAGLPIAERVVRAAFRAGYSPVVVFAPCAGRDSRQTNVQNNGTSTSGVRRLAAVLRHVRGEIIFVRSAADWRRAVGSLPPTESLTIAGPGTVPSPALLENARLLSPFGSEVCDVAAGPDWRESGVLRVGREVALDLPVLEGELALRRVRRAPLPSGEDVSLGRARLTLRIVTDADLAAAERTMRRSTYKDTDATVARFNRRMSLPISIALIRTPLTANQLSLFLVALGLYSAWLFSIGHYWTGVLGASLSLAAGILDGCDGEIARLKYQESALGCWLETIGDYSYYLAIFFGLTVGAARQTEWGGFYWLGGLALAGTLLSFALLIYLRSRITAGRPERLHAIARARFMLASRWWSRVAWRISFVATRAAMPYGILALALINALPAVIVLACIGANLYWVILLLKLRDLLKPLAAPPAPCAS